MNQQHDEALSVSLFYSYAYEDEDLRNKLEKHLSLLRHQGFLSTWSDRQIMPGTDCSKAINTHLNSAAIILLLISSDFLNSNYRYGIEMQRALERHNSGKATVIPIMLRPVDWQGAPFAHLQGLPSDMKPVTSWSNQDEALKQIAEGIRRLVKVLRQHVFVISSPDDQAFRERFSQDLATQGFILYQENEEKSQDADVDEKVNAQAIRTALSVYLLVSPSAPYSYTVGEQLKLATLAGRHIIAVWITGEDLNQCLPRGWERKMDVINGRDELYKDALSQVLTHAREQRNRFLSLSSGAETSELLLVEPNNPYKGLEAFTGRDARYFFGRGGLVDDLASALKGVLTLQRTGKQTSHLITILGASGSGKSSAVMAGLLPYLSSGGVLNSKDWLYLDRMLPGKHPLEALAITLARRLPERGAPLLLDDLRSDSTRSLHLIIMQIAQSTRTNVVLFVDQLEELFTLTTSEEERQHFIDLLVTAVTECDGPLIVILTLRADFYDRPMKYPVLSRIMQEHVVQVLPMEVADLRAAIEQPALLPEVRIAFEDSLVGDLLFEAKGQEGILPLIQFTLEKLFQRRRGRLLTRQAYDDIGGVKGALAKHAEDVYICLPSDEHRGLSKDLFLRLIKLSAVEQDTTRRRALKSEFLRDDLIQARLLRETMENFIEARLLTANGNKDNGTIEVSHEALIREWPRLSEWLREARDDILLQQRISDDVADWERQHKSADRLYRGSELEKAQDWAKRRRLSKKEDEFLRASAIQEQKAHAQQRILVSAGLVLSVLLVISLIVALLQQINLVDTQQKLLTSLPVSVTNLADHGPGSLRSAIEQSSRGSVVTFAKNMKGIISLTTGELRITKKITISGPGASSLSISGGNTSRIFSIESNAAVVLSNITITNGYSKRENGGAILNNGSLSIINCTISKSIAESGYGGGIFNKAGQLTLINSIVANNIGAYGIGIYNASGTLTVTNSSIVGNKVGNTSLGFRTTATAIIENSYSKELKTDSIDNTSSNFRTFLANKTLNAHIPLSGIGSWGGGISNDGILTLINSTVARNEANSGGGLANVGGTALIIASTFSENRARPSASGAGIDNIAILTIINSTITRNQGQGNGGGIATTGLTNITFCTIYDNTSVGFGGGIYITEDFNKQYPQITIKNSIIAGNHASSFPDISGRLISSGYNLIQDASGAALKVDKNSAYGTAPDLIGLSPKVGSLQDNGGPTQTLALQPNSPAINRIPSGYCLDQGIHTDQRGTDRPDPELDRPDPNSADFVKCDIGAYQTIDYKPINTS